MLNLRSKVRQRLLSYFFTNPRARNHVRDLAQRLDLDPSNLSKELARLERERLLHSEVSGRQKYFQLNQKHPLHKELRGIITKTIGVAPLLTECLARIGGLKEAFLYGSFARNQEDAASDVDLLVIGKPDEAELAEAMDKLERQIGREINYTVLTAAELRQRLSRKDAFLENIWHNKRVLLIGSDETTKNAQGRLGTD